MLFPTSEGPNLEVCGCASTETTCYVDDYSPAGAKLQTRLFCALKGQRCPCGTNTNFCRGTPRVGFPRFGGSETLTKVMTFLQT